MKRTDGGSLTGLCANISDARKVLSSEKDPSSKTSRNSTPPSRAWMEWGTPLTGQLTLWS